MSFILSKPGNGQKSLNTPLATVVFSCVIEVKGTSVMDEKLILKIIDSLINNSHQSYTWPFPYTFCWLFLTHRSHFPVARPDMQRRVTHWLNFSLKHYKINLHPDKHPALSFLISPLLPLSVPLAQGLVVLAEALCCKCGSACPVINRSELHRSAVQTQVTASCSTSMLWLAHCANRFTSAPRCLIPALFDPGVYYQTHFVLQLYMQ